VKIAIVNNSRKFAQYGMKIKGELEKLGAEATVLFSDELQLTNFLQFDRFDVIFSRLSGLKWTFELYHQLVSCESRIIPCPFYFLHSQNKYLMTVIAQQHGISVPKTALISIQSEFLEENLQAANQIKYPLVMKPLYSSLQGKDAFLIQDQHELEHRLCILQERMNASRDLIGTRDYFLLQERIVYDKIIRSFVIEGETKDAASAELKDGWKCSACGASLLKKQEISSELRAFNRSIFAAFRGEVMILDAFNTKEGLILNECNTACGLQNMQSATGKNHAHEIATYLTREAKQIIRKR